MHTDQPNVASTLVPTTDAMVFEAWPARPKSATCAPEMLQPGFREHWGPRDQEGTS